MARVFVKDGEDLQVIVALPPSVADPAGEFPAIVNLFRVVASGALQPLLNLVPLAQPVLVRDDTYARIKKSADNVGRD